MNMNFEVDKQTLKDLEIFDTFKNGKSIFSLFNFTRSMGGKRKLYNFLSSPSANLDEITERRDAIAFFQEYIPSGLTVDKNALDFSEYYLKHGNYPTRMPSRFSAIERRLMSFINQSPEYYLIEKGVSSTVELLNDIYRFALVLAEKLKGNDYPKLLSRTNKDILTLFSKREYSELIGLKRIKAFDTAKLDYMFRYTHRKDIAFFHSLVYEYDAFYAVTKAAKKYQLAYPEILPEKETTLEIDGIFHPFIENGIPNDIHFGKSSNLLFITGPNMAGKSTFLKALGVSVYLAHIGFPVPAKSLKLSVLSGLCTTINMSDNLSSGYSHFYAEVMRVKDVAERLKTNKNMLVLFDELFRGTNVKDAYDGTLAVVSALAQIRSSFFVVSTHIVEVTKELQKNSNIRFCYFEIQEENGDPVYTYKLKEGVSDVRLGMYIIRKEGLIELINNIKHIDQ
ncbi:MAG: MutS-related protein [Dysgonomonas sp.]